MAESKGALLAKSVQKHAGRAKEKDLIEILDATKRKRLTYIFVRESYKLLRGNWVGGYEWIWGGKIYSVLFRLLIYKQQLVLVVTQRFVVNVLIY
ncbi:Protein of unknown function [Gryllus bimaculatus]|nr:Protein of unknown function [Gryllus bimaculatus]